MFAKPWIVTPRTPLIRPAGREKAYSSLQRFSLCTIIELKLSLRTRLARQTHARPVETFIASLALWFC